jgi:hypothetical protein
VYVALLAIVFPLARRYTLRRIARGTDIWYRDFSEGERAKLALHLDRYRWYPMNWPASTLFGSVAIVTPSIADIHRLVVPIETFLLALPTLFYAWRNITERATPVAGPYGSLNKSAAGHHVLLLFLPHGFVIWGRLGPYPL